MRSWREVSDSRLRRRMIFSPNVMYEDPYKESSLITRLVRGGRVLGEVVEIVDVTIYCSFKTSYRVVSRCLGRDWLHNPPKLE